MSNFIWGLLGGLVFGFAWGYNYGKRMLFELIKQHIDNGLDPQRSIDYEFDVFEGRVPRG
jgi:hypothetical protein